MKLSSKITLFQPVGTRTLLLAATIFTACGSSLHAVQRARFVPSSSIENRPAEEANPFRGMKAPVRRGSSRKAPSRKALSRNVARAVPKKVDKQRIEKVGASFETTPAKSTEEPASTEESLLWLSRSDSRQPQPSARRTSPSKRAELASAEPREFVAPESAEKIEADVRPKTRTAKNKARTAKTRPSAKPKRPLRSRKFDPFEEEVQHPSSQSRVARSPKSRRSFAKKRRKRSANDGIVNFQSERFSFDDIMADNLVGKTLSNQQNLEWLASGTESDIESAIEPEIEQAGYFGCPDCGYSECTCEGGYGCDCGTPGCDGGACGGGYGIFRAMPRYLPRPREFTLFAGVHAFKGPLDGNRDSGNFGFQEGFNWGGKLPWRSLSGVGYQVGYQLTHSQLHGSTIGTSDSLHTQQFITAGLFRRPPCGGLQYGVVWDVLRDERFGSVDYHQVRSEIGLINNRGREIGIHIAVHANDTSSTNVAFQSTDQFLVYYRIHAQHGGEARFFGGLDDDAAGILGADMQMPINDRLSIASGFTYLIPQEGAGQNAASEEAWNLGFNLVWHMGCRARSCHRNLYRPLFNVADNGSLIVDHR